MSLRPLTEADLLLILPWRNTPDVRENMYSKHEISEAEHRTWFACVRHDKQSRWYIHEDNNGTPDGVVYFTQYQPENRNSFWGFYAGFNAVPGTGSRMQFAALDLAFSELKLHKLNGEVLSSNAKSINLHKKFGFAEEGRFRDFHFNGENFVDVVRFGILESEWKTKRVEISDRLTNRDTAR